MDPLAILELSPGCTYKEAEKNFKRLALKYHPDKSKNPETAKKFSSIVSAIKRIRENPSILDSIQSTKPTHVKGFIYTAVTVSIEDVYFARPKYIHISRKVLCPDCEGSGSYLKKDGVCDVCGGQGNIKNKVMSLLREDPTCPECDGKGYKKETACSKCSGSKLVSQIIPIEFKVDLKECQEKTVVIRGKGNQELDGKFGDVHIRVNLEEGGRIHLDGWGFKKYVSIHPLRRILREPVYVTIFGKKLKVKFMPDNSDTEIVDIRDDINYPRKVRIIFVDKDITPSEETIVLYKKIIQIEKD
jgi:DnaJ-class molecular chaperone